MDFAPSLRCGDVYLEILVFVDTTTTAVEELVDTTTTVVEELTMWKSSLIRQRQWYDNGVMGDRSVGVCATSEAILIVLLRELNLL